jgi:hypothetical protein
MRAILILTALGLTLSISGIQTIYFYITHLDEGASILFLLLAIVLIGVGIYLLMRAGKSDVTVFTRLKNFRNKNTGDSQVLAQVLEKNNELTKEWDKTIEKRDRLKMLEISTAAAADVSE